MKHRCSDKLWKTNFFTNFSSIACLICLWMPCFISIKLLLWILVCHPLRGRRSWCEKQGADCRHQWAVVTIITACGIESCFAFTTLKCVCLCACRLWQSKKKFERECREAEKSQMLFERLDNDINATKSEVEKVSKQLAVFMGYSHRHFLVIFTACSVGYKCSILLSRSCRPAWGCFYFILYLYLLVIIMLAWFKGSPFFQAKSQLYLRTHMADESKNEYAAQLQNFNSEQWKHFNVAIPQIFKVTFDFCCIVLLYFIELHKWVKWRL